jgi:hypothetical protein
MYQEFLITDSRPIYLLKQFSAELGKHLNDLLNSPSTYGVIHERLPMKISLYATQNTRNPKKNLIFGSK